MSILFTEKTSFLKSGVQNISYGSPQHPHIKAFCAFGCTCTVYTAEHAAHCTWHCKNTPKNLQFENDKVDNFTEDCGDGNKDDDCTEGNSAGDEVDGIRYDEGEDGEDGVEIEEDDENEVDSEEHDGNDEIEDEFDVGENDGAGNDEVDENEENDGEDGDEDIGEFDDVDDDADTTVRGRDAEIELEAARGDTTGEARGVGRGDDTDDRGFVVILEQVFPVRRCEE